MKILRLFCTVPALLVAASGLAHAAAEDSAVCNIAQQHIHYSTKSFDIFDGGQALYKVTVDGAPKIHWAARPFAINYPTNGIMVQLFYHEFLDDPDSDPYLIGCLRTPDGMSLEQTFDADGGGHAPVPLVFFTQNLKKPYGKTLLVLMRWHVSAAPHTDFASEGDLFQTMAFSQPSVKNGWHEQPNWRNA